MDCPCSLRVKTYPGSSTVLGFYDAVHNHETGSANLPYVRISAEIREFIAGLLRLGVEPSHIVSELSFNREEVAFSHLTFSSHWFTKAFINRTMTTRTKSPP